MKQTLTNAASVLAGETLVRSLNFLVPIWIARVYDSSSLGKYSLGLACAALAGLLPDMGLHLLTTREVASHPEKLSDYFWNVQSLKLLLCLASACLVFVGTELWVDEFLTRWILRVLTLRFLLQSFSYFFMAIVKAFEQMHYLMLLQAVNVSIVVICFSLGVSHHVSLPLLLCAFLPGVLCEAGLGLFLIFKRFSPRPFVQPSWKRARSIASAAFPIGLTTLLITLNFRLDVIVLAWFRPSSEVGLFSAANIFSAGFFLLASLAISIIFPKLSKLSAKSETPLQSYVEALFKLFLFFLVPISMVFFFGAFLILQSLYGAQYEPAAPVLRILAFSLPLIFLNAIFFYVFVARARRSSYFWVMLNGIGINLLLTPLLSWKFGMEGTAFSNLVRESCQTVLFIYLSVQEKTLLASTRIFVHAGVCLFFQVALGLSLLQLGINPVLTLSITLAVYFTWMLASGNLPRRSELLLLAR